MKKKYREITVDGVKYAWSVRDNHSVNIWRDSRIIYKDSGYTTGSITPSLIRKAIKIIVKHPNEPKVINRLSHIEYLTTEAKELIQEIKLLNETMNHLM